jgi:phosphate transport system ATP-binding protein
MLLWTSQPDRLLRLSALPAVAKARSLRCFNRTNDLIPGARVEGKLTYHGKDLYAKEVDPVAVRRRIGMVFQKPNPFPKSIYDNVAYGPRGAGDEGRLGRGGGNLAETGCPLG